jgi:hypothetical protein
MPNSRSRFAGTPAPPCNYRQHNPDNVSDGLVLALTSSYFFQNSLSYRFGYFVSDYSKFQYPPGLPGMVKSRKGYGDGLGGHQSILKKFRAHWGGWRRLGMDMKGGRRL